MGNTNQKTMDRTHMIEQHIEQIVAQKYGPTAVVKQDPTIYIQDGKLITATISKKNTLVPAVFIFTKVPRGYVVQMFEHTHQVLVPTKL
jgi:hypothetical protein